MKILERAQKMLEKYPLCNHCLGRQFALLGYGVDNKKRGEALKLILTMKGHQLSLVREKAGISLLKTMATNGAFDMAAEILRKMKKRVGKRRECHLCRGLFGLSQGLVESSVEKLQNYEYTTFLVGIELPTEVEEREDEFKAKFAVKHGENMRNEFSRDIGKKLSEITQKTAEYAKPEVVVLVNPFTKQVTLQVNPLYIMGKYKKLTRGIPQSKWLCSECRGKGCQQCNWTGKMYSESVEEISPSLALVPDSPNKIDRAVTVLSGRMRLPDESDLLVKHVGGAFDSPRRLSRKRIEVETTGRGTLLS